jgi:hypothetical protein
MILIKIADRESKNESKGMLLRLEIVLSKSA